MKSLIRPSLSTPGRQSSILPTLFTILISVALLPTCSAVAVPAVQSPIPSRVSYTPLNLPPRINRHDLPLLDPEETALPFLLTRETPTPTPIPPSPTSTSSYTTPAIELELAKRQDSSSAEIVVETSGASTAVTTTVVTSPLPSPFDGNLAATFVSEDGSCPKFINAMLTAQQFKDCYPFSLLIQGSNGFFEAEKSAVSITQVLQATCAADKDTCQPYLTNLAEELILEENCKADFEEETSVVVQAYFGLMSYGEMYSASCLQDEEQGGYCFTRAITNYSDSSDTSIYFLPLNISMPDDSLPSCSWCVQQTMNIYQSAAADRTLPIAETYESAAEQINTLCGPGWVNETLPAATVEESLGIPSTTVSGGSALLAGAAMFVVLLQHVLL